MFSLNHITLGEVSYSAGYFQYTVISSRAQSQLLDSYFQKLIRSFRHLAVFSNLPGLHTGATVDSRSGKALMLDLTRSINALSDLVGVFASRFPSELLIGYGGYFYMDVNPIQKWT